MINASELRIGNIVFHNSNAFEIKGISKRSVTAFEDGYFDDNSTSLNDLEPIELIPEILQACGFEEFLENEFILAFSDTTINMSLKENTKCTYTLSDITTWQSKEIPCKYLHQLQNLYFALTRTELEVKLPQFAS